MTVLFNPPTRASGSLLEIIDEQKDDPLCLATLVAIEGNAPYPVGSHMWINEQGKFYGQITGGCAEQAIADHAVLALQTACPSTVRYGLNSPYFDIQLPCGSGIDVHFNVEVTSSERQGWCQCLAQRRAVTSSFSTELGVFEQRFLPIPRLLVAGQGPIVIALAQLAIASGIEVAIASQNEATDALAADQGLVTQRIGSFDTAALLSDEFLGIVSLFHEHDLEIPLFAELLQGQAFYYGALGSQRTHARRIEHLAKRGVAAKKAQQISGPIGIDIGANSPQQIAISVLAEFIQFWNQRVEPRYPRQLMRG